MFDSSSRYYALETLIYTGPDGRQVAYKSRRFLPPAPTGAPLAEHAGQQEERLDHLAARFLGDPELFWQLCDVNNAMRPEELTEELGRKIRISLLSA